MVLNRFTMCRQRTSIGRLSHTSLASLSTVRPIAEAIANRIRRKNARAATPTVPSQALSAEAEAEAEALAAIASRAAIVALAAIAVPLSAVSVVRVLRHHRGAVMALQFYLLQEFEYLHV
jgi:hypothetical protein